MSGFGRASAGGVHVLVDGGAGLGEGPCWDEREGVLWWVDIVAGTLHRFDPGSGTDTAVNLPIPASAVVPRRRGGLVLALRKGYYGFDPASNDLELLCGVETEVDTNRLNDAKCDPAGRLWGGTMADDEAPGAGAFYRLDLDGELRRIWDEVTCSNGIGWSPDGSRMYYIDSGTGRVDVCDYNLESGAATNRAPFARIEAPAEPDGLTVDSEGGVWVALWAGGALQRYLPDGSLERAVRLPALNVTSCEFGGERLETLFVTSATIRTTPRQQSEHPHGGALFQLRPGVSGMPANGYAG